MEKRLTKGNLVKILISFTLPLILSGVFQQLFNWVDAFIVGNVNGESALAAVGATTSTYNLSVMVITGFVSGLSVLSAQKYGMGEKEESRYILSSFSVLMTLIFTVISILGIVFIDHILTFLDTPTEIYSQSRAYLRIIFVGIPFLALYNVFSAVLRGIGDSRISFLSVLAASCVNIALDLLFVLHLKYGTAGAAMATAISQAAMAFLIIIYTVVKYPFLRFGFHKNIVKKSIIISGCRYGLPLAVQSGIVSGGNLILQRFMNGFGEQTVAAITSSYRVDSVILLPIINFGSGVSTVTAQNIGAKEYNRAKQVLKIGIRIIVVTAICLSLLVFGAGESLIGIFGLTPEAVTIGGKFFRTIASFYVVYALATVFRGYLEGTGDMLFSGIVGVAALAVRIVSSYAFRDLCGNMVIAYAEAFSWAVLLIIYIVRYLFKKKPDDYNDS